MSSVRIHGRALARILGWLVLLALVVGVAWGWLDYRRFRDAPLDVTHPGQSLEVARGTGLRGIVAELHRRGFTHDAPLYWRALAAQMGVSTRLHAGEYALAVGVTPRALLTNMAAGKVMQHDLTLVDGWTFHELRLALAQATALRHDSAALDDTALMARIGAPGQFPEGRFLPETYAYVKGDSDLDVLRRAHAAMDRTLDQLWPRRAKEVTLGSPYEALILASIVQKESARPDERAKIAQVFLHRLQQHMLLQTDPTVIYGMGASYAGNIHKADLAVDTPYNTYTRPGLPPTPIAMPGRAAIQATLHPAPGDALYFVARGDGSHVFADTLEEHNRNVACYQLKRCP